MPPSAAAFVCSIRLGRPIVKALVRAFFVEVADVVGDALSRLRWCCVRMQIDLFHLEAAPEMLHLHVVQPPPFPSIEMRTPCSLSTPVNASDVNCAPGLC